MRKTIIVLLLTFLLTNSALVSCNSNSNEKTKSANPSSDTIRTLALYKFNNEATVNYIYRVVRDTFKLTPKDSLTSIKEWTKDTAYWIPIKDSLRDKTGKPVFDTASKQFKLQLRYYLFPKDLILIDGNKDVTEILKKNNLR